jgi:protease I
MVRFVRDAARASIPIAAICHGPWMLCSTDVLRGRRATSYMSIAHDVANAGATWVDEACVVDGPVITSRTPDDLPSFMRAVLAVVDGETPKGQKGHAIAPEWVKQTLPAGSNR